MHTNGEVPIMCVCLRHLFLLQIQLKLKDIKISYNLFLFAILDQIHLKTFHHIVCCNFILIFNLSTLTFNRLLNLLNRF